MIPRPYPKKRNIYTIDIMIFLYIRTRIFIDYNTIVRKIFLKKRGREQKMQNKDFLFVAWAAFVVSFAFVLISIWNNVDWALIDRGYYTICLGWITFSVFALVNLMSLRSDGMKVAGEFIFFSWLSTAASIIIGMVSVNNTDWILMEKGYYWMGFLFTAFTTYVLVKAIRDKQKSYTDTDEGLKFSFLKSQTEE